MEKFTVRNLDLPGFINELSNCTGNVWMSTEDGDKINLQSAFCRLIGLKSILEGGKLSEATIECENPDDESRLFRFNLYGRSSSEDEE